MMQHSPESDRASHLPLTGVAGVAIGNALEFYDFLSFSFFAVQIGHTFFPTAQTAHGLLYTLAVFGVGFITRPIGGIIIGAYADRAGRRPAMLLSFSLMGLAIVGLALTPGYATIGISAPILLVVFRLLSGFALGGEVGPSTAFLLEVAPPHRRGLYVGLQYATQDLAVLIAGAVGLVLSLMLSPDALDHWGWRIAFLLGASIVPFGLTMRRRLPETLHSTALRHDSPVSQLPPARVFLLGILILGSATIAYYGIEYLNTYCQDTLHLSAQLAFGTTIVLGVTTIVADIGSGIASDHVGRKPIMLAAASAVLIAIVPVFFLINRIPEPWMIFSVTAALGVLSACISVPALTSITESLPAHIRSGMLGTLYAIAMSVFGGTTQFVAKGLIGVTHNPLAPAFYIMSAMGVGVLAMRLMRETSPAALRNSAR